MDPETINDWGTRKRVSAQKSDQKGMPSLQVCTPERISHGLVGFTPSVLNVLCYEDVGYPWVQVVFNELIGPEVALRLGDVLTSLAGDDRVYLNSLRPKAVYFVIEPAFEPQPDLKAQRYGALLSEVRQAWR